MSRRRRTPSEKHRARLVREARKAVTREASARDRHLAKDDLGKIKVQTVNPVVRAAVFTAGCGSIALSIFVWGDTITQVIIALLLACMGLSFCGLAVFGQKKTLDESLESFGDAASQQILDSILDGLF